MALTDKQLQHRLEAKRARRRRRALTGRRSPQHSKRAHITVKSLQPGDLATVKAIGDAAVAGLGFRGRPRSAPTAPQADRQPSRIAKLKARLRRGRDA